MNWKDFKSASIILVILIFNFLFAQDLQIKSFYDGPNIFYDKDSLIIKYAIDSTAHIHNIKMTENTSFVGFHRDSNQTYFIPQKFINAPDVFNKKRKILVISDIHGQYEIFKELLINNGVIDSTNSWIWGKGHLVILGDTFDKGAKVHESLWLAYELEKQAREAGGFVHFILGNHEVKALRGDLKYVTDNYFKLADILTMTIPDLYFDNTFWGKWLRSKNVIVKIGDLLFVHGGIHPKIVTDDYSIKKINKIMRDNIDLSLEEIKLDATLSFLFRKNGPIRYRGFFQPDTLAEVSNEQITEILNHFNADKIIVGHTSSDHIHSSHNNRVICVDARIMYGIGGEALLIKGNKYFSVDLNGKKTRIL